MTEQILTRHRWDQTDVTELLTRQWWDADNLSLTDLLDAPVLDSLSVDSGDPWQQLTVLLPAERQVSARLRWHGWQEDRLVEGSLQTGVCCWTDRAARDRRTSSYRECLSWTYWTGLCRYSSAFIQRSQALFSDPGAVWHPGTNRNPEPDLIRAH